MKRNRKNKVSDDTQESSLQVISETEQQETDTQGEISEEVSEDTIEEEYTEAEREELAEIEVLKEFNKSIPLSKEKPQIVIIKPDFREPFGGQKGVAVRVFGDLLKVVTDAGTVIVHKKYIKSM